MRLLTAILVPLALLASQPALALPLVGTALPIVKVKTVDGLGQDVPAGNRPTLILYESRASRPQNYPLKTKLKLLAAQTPTYRDRLLVVPIANLQAYDFWPIRGLAASAVRSEVKKVGSAIYCDWNGAIARALGARAEMASVILVDAAGRVLFAAEGPLTPGDQDRVLGLLRIELDD